MVAGLLLFLARHLTLTRIDPNERKLRVGWALPYFLSPTSAATDYREMAGRELTLPALRAGAEYDDIHQMKRSWDSWRTSTSL